MGEAIAFYILAFFAVLGGVLMVTRRNPLAGAMSLVLSLVSLAGIFAVLHAEFVFILQILLYAGAIMVLVIFTIMLLNLTPEEVREPPIGKFRTLIIFAACAAGLFAFISAVLTLPAGFSEVSNDFGSIEAVGRLMLSHYVYPFEVISVLLLVAVAGVVLLAKKVI